MAKAKITVLLPMGLDPNKKYGISFNEEMKNYFTYELDDFLQTVHFKFENFIYNSVHQCVFGDLIIIGHLSDIKSIIENLNSANAIFRKEDIIFE